MFFGADRRLGDATASGSDAARVDRALGTGERTRWRGVLAAFVPADYPDLGARFADQLGYVSAPLDDDLEIAGHPEARLFLRTDATDATVFVYLVDEAPDGRLHYVTEGQLRAKHRNVVAPPPGFVALRPHRTYAGRDAKPIEPGTPTELAIGLLPAAHLFRRGHRVRVFVTGADRDHFAPPPDGFGGFELLRGEATPSRLILPVVPT
jgi:putative CocE/NonD family hydrolase